MKKVHKMMVSKDGTRSTIEFDDGSTQFIQVETFNLKRVLYIAGIGFALLVIIALY